VTKFKHISENKIFEDFKEKDKELKIKKSKFKYLIYKKGKINFMNYNDIVDLVLKEKG